jgi:hypothetical protein
MTTLITAGGVPDGGDKAGHEGVLREPHQQATLADTYSKPFARLSANDSTKTQRTAVTDKQ